MKEKDASDQLIPMLNALKKSSLFAQDSIWQMLTLVIRINAGARNLVADRLVLANRAVDTTLAVSSLFLPPMVILLLIAPMMTLLLAMEQLQMVVLENG